MKAILKPFFGAWVIQVGEHLFPRLYNDKRTAIEARDAINEHQAKRMTLAEFAERINEAEEWRLEFNEIISANGWNDETGQTWGICSDSNGHRLRFDDQGVAYIQDWWEE